MSDLAYGTPVKAANADVWMIDEEHVHRLPESLGRSVAHEPHARSPTRTRSRRTTTGARAELVHWTSADGKPLKGILVQARELRSEQEVPDDLVLLRDPLERLVQLRRAERPQRRSTRRTTSSNGYLVFEPDIVYEDGHPGMSAYKSIVPGVQSLLQRGYVDEKKLGLQGQSWGGYQTAYLITQTHMFSAAMAGAPVANMTSAYGGIRWGSGIARSGQYESGQSRIGQPLVDAPQLYLENSPLFRLRNVTTPLFIMSNDMDDAVPWYQGIEFFVGMRRLGQGGVPDRLQQRRAQPGEPREPEGHRDAHAAVLRQQADGQAGAGLDGARHSVSSRRARISWRRRRCRRA